MSVWAVGALFADGDERLRLWRCRDELGEDVSDESGEDDDESEGQEYAVPDGCRACEVS